MPGAGARVCMGLTIVTLLGSVLTPATAVTLYNGFGTGDSFNTGSFATVGRSFIEGMPADTDQAATFTVPVEGHFSLDAIEIAVTLFTGMNELDVFLVGHDAAAGPLGAPDEGQLLESFHLSNAIVRDVPGPPGTESIVFIPSLTRPLLKAGVQYWVMLSTPDPNTLIQWWAAAEELGPGPTVKAERFNLGPWEVVNATGPGQAFRIQGTPAVLDVTIDIKPGGRPQPHQPQEPRQHFGRHPLDEQLQRTNHGEDKLAHVWPDRERTEPQPLQLGGCEPGWISRSHLSVRYPDSGIPDWRY
jgi:hypothetical protein